MDNNTENMAGTLKVSSSVIVSIAETAASEIEGVALTSAKKLAVMADAPLVKKLVSPIKVRFRGDSAAIGISIVTEIGYKAFDVAKAVQENVKSSVQNMTGITVSKVNVRVIGIKSK